MFMFCMRCGQKNTDGFAFCTACGKPLNIEITPKMPIPESKPEAPTPGMSPPPSYQQQPYPQPPPPGYHQQPYQPPLPGYHQPSHQQTSRFKKRLFKKSILITFCAFACVAAAVVLFFLVLTPASPGAVSQVIAPSDDPITVKYGAYSITVPGGTVQKNETLSITQVDVLPKALEELEPLCPAIDVQLGSLTEFTEPIVIEIPYDKSKLHEASPDDAFVAVYYDEETGFWNDVPYEVDESKAVVKLLMHHLTTIQCYFSRDDKAMVYGDRSIRVFYYLKERIDMSDYEQIKNMYKMEKVGQEYYDAYEKAVDRLIRDEKAPQFVSDIYFSTKTILEYYSRAGLQTPPAVKIYITEGKNNYNSFTGNFSVSLDIATQAEPEKLMLRNLAHELFHGAQQWTMGDFDYWATGRKNASFWVEATADYMGNTGFWDLRGKTPIGKYDYYNLNFFFKSLYTMDGSHEYEAANFVAFVQQQKKASPVKLVSIAESYSSFPASFDSVYGGSLNLLDYYRTFMEYSLFDNASYIQAKNNSTIKDWVAKKTNLTFELDEAGKGLPPMQQGSGSLNFAGEYTADFYLITTNCDTTLTITPESNLILYLCNSTHGSREYDKRVEAIAGSVSQIDFGKDDFVLIAQASPVKGSVSFGYEAEPTSQAPEQTSTPESQDMAVCKRCGASVNPGKDYCYQCVCSRCGAELNPEDFYCNYCGQQVR